MGSASVGAASVGSASVGAASVGSASVGAADRDNLARPGVPPKGDPRKAAPVVGAKAAAVRPPQASPSETLTGLRGAGSELRTRMRTQRKLRMVTLLSLAVVVLVVLPAFFGLRSATRDPVFSSLDALDVPSWAATEADDQSSGSRWCFLECRFRERTAQSDKDFKQTTAAYTSALRAAGWQPWKVAECPEQPVDPANTTYSCWTRDEFTLDLRVGLPQCAVDELAAQNPAALPSGAPEPSTGKCEGSTVNIKVQAAVEDPRGGPEPQQSPGLVGETPDPVPSDDVLLEPTPKAS